MLDEEWFDTALICLNGHVVNAASEWRPRYNCNFCPDCGALAISKCPGCQTPIPGQAHYFSRDDDTFGDGNKFVEPKPYCGGCGKPYPWTVSRAQAFVELAQLSLSADDADEIEADLPDVMRDTPRTEVAVKKIFQRFNSAGAWGMSILNKAAPEIFTKGALLVLQHLVKP